MTYNNYYRHLLLSALIVFLFLLTTQTSKAQWSDMPSLSNGKINVLSKKGQVLFAGTDTGGIHTSTNFGVDWDAKNNGITNKKIVAFVLKDNALIAGVGDGFGGSVFVSNDEAASWQVPTQNYNGFLFCLAEQGDDVLAGTWYGVAKSTDDGDTWNTLSTVGLPSNASVSAILTNGTTLFAAVSSSSTNEPGMFRSTNNGDTWEDKSAGLVNTNFTAMAQIDSTLVVSTIGGGVYASSNNGESWTTANTGMGSLIVNCLYASGNNLLAGTNEGIFLSNDKAASWTNISTGLPPNTKVNSITTCGSFLFLGTDSAVWRRPTAEVITHLATKPSEISLAVYPNPSRGEFTVDMPENATEISVSNMLGQVVYKKENPMAKQIIIMTGFNKGLFLISVKTTKGIVSKKIVLD